MNNITLAECKAYIAENKIVPKRFRMCVPKLAELDAESPEDFMTAYRSGSFRQVLFGYIDKSGLKDSDVYKKAFIDRRLFSKIRSGEDYIPCKKTVLALALALELGRNDADTLLQSAGYSLSRSNDYDLIIAFCIEKKIYDLFEINEILERFELEVF